MSEWSGQDRRVSDRRLDALERSVTAIREMLDRYAEESTAYRKETRCDIKALHASWVQYRPVFDAIIEQQRLRKERTEKLKTHVIGWGAVTAVSALIYMIGIAIRTMVERGSP